MHQDMAISGLKSTSSQIVISFNNPESAANTFTQAVVDLQLNPLDNEVFVVQSIDLEVGLPDALPGTDSATRGSISTTSRTTLGGLNNSNTMAIVQKSIRAAGWADSGVAFFAQSGESPPTQLDYLAIIATNDFFIQCQGSGNLTAKSVSGKLYGYRAKASASVFAALVQSEILS